MDQEYSSNLDMESTVAVLTHPLMTESIEYIIYIMYGTSFFWVIGLLMYIPLGLGMNGYNIYIWYMSLYNYLSMPPESDPAKELDNFWWWIVNPLRRDLVQELLFVLGILAISVPLLGPVLHLGVMALMYFNMLLWWYPEMN